MKLKILRDFYVISLTILIVLSFETSSIPAQAGKEKPISMKTPVNSETALFGNTAAEAKFAAWLAAFNTGRKEVLEQFISANFAPPPNIQLPVGKITDRQFELFNNTHGLIPRKVIANSEKSAGVYLESKSTGFTMYVGMNVEENAPHKILGMGFRNTEAPAELLPKQKLTKNQLRAKIDRLITELSEANKFSGVILVAHNGKPVYQRAYGLASRTWNIQNRLDTKFNLASIGKMFTAIAVTQLVEQGKLSFDDPLSRVLPDYPNKNIAQKVTVRHLLSHTSGIKETFSLEDAFRRGFRSVKEYLSAGTADKLNFEPGTKLEYSNYGYILLGAVIEKASGENYYDYVREHIYQPSGMTDTDSYELDSEPQNLATGYMDAPNNKRVSNIFMLAVKGTPAGGGYSTAGDLVKFMSALQSGKLINPKSLETVWTGNMNYTEHESKYGYGFIIRKYNGSRIIGHGGGWVGITNKFDMYPELGYTVVILNNIDSDPNSIALKLREWLTQGHNSRE